MQGVIVVSIVVCVYNGEKYLAETLESVSQQTGFGVGGEGIEVIMIDDRSTDGSVDIIKRYAGVLESKGFTVRCIFHTENKQTVRSYTEGASLALGKYFKILDHDDSLASARAIADPVGLARSLESEGHDVGIVFSKALYMDEQGVIFGEKRFPFPFVPYEAQNGLIPRRWGEFVLAFSPLYPFVHGASVVRKTCWQELSINYQAKHGAGLFDVLFAIHVMHSRKWRVAYLRDASLQYRIHPSSFTQSADRVTWANILNAEYENIYGRGILLTIIKTWTAIVQWTKSLYHRLRGSNAFKAIALFGRR